MATCKMCFTKPAYTIDYAGIMLCVACFDELHELNCSGTRSSEINWINNTAVYSTSVSSLFWYSGPIRSQIINAKVKGDVTSLAGILRIWAKETEQLPMLKQIDAVMPCPSSLWGRLHGKIDIAWFLASHVSRIHKIKLLLPPRRNQWNLKKRSRTERPVDKTVERFVDKPLISDRQGTSQRCLLIDDVITTGTTLKTCMESVGRDHKYSFEALTFARAR